MKWLQKNVEKENHEFHELRKLKSNAIHGKKSNTVNNIIGDIRTSLGVVKNGDWLFKAAILNFICKA